MSFPVNEIVFEWDEKDPLRFKMCFGDIDLNMDAPLARKIAAAMNDMADRVDRRITKVLDGLES